MTRRQLAQATVVFALFAAYATWRSPVPGVNEPHYLCKAKHFSDRLWCPRDFFLESADAHWVFFAVIGPCTRILSFEQTAWLGRIAVWCGLAFGWVKLAESLAPGKLLAVWAAAIFLAIESTVAFSGEWLVGGVEAKGFSYAALFLAIAAVAGRSWMKAAAAAGVAISVHPVVGAWGAVALAVASLTRWISAVAGRPAADPQGPAPGPAGWRSLVLAGALCLGCALPGLIPATQIVTERPSGIKGRLADEIQVFDRLDHHLDPAQFPVTAYVAYAGLLAAWLAMRRVVDRTAGEMFFARFVLAACAIAAVGLAVGFSLRPAGVMKFYPFRLMDIFLPIAASMTAAAALERAPPLLSQRRAGPARAIGPAIASAAFAWGMLAPGRIENPSGFVKYRETWPAFLEACAWIDAHTPPQALFLTPKVNVGFKWYARRAEYVTIKDCPQDAAGILEWKARLDRVARWRDSALDDGLSEIALAQLFQQTQVDYFLTWTAEKSTCRPVFRNGSFSVYRVWP